MGLKQETIRANVAGIGRAPSLQQADNAAKKKGGGLKLLGYAAALIPLVGIPVSYLLDRTRNNVVSKSRKEVLAKYYRFQIGAIVGKNPDDVDAKDFELATKLNPELKAAAEKINAEQRGANRSATFSNGAVFAISGANLIPGLGLAGKIVTDMAAGTAGEKVSDLFNKDVLHVHDIVIYLDGKLKAGEAITGHDVMLLRAAQDTQWQENFKKRYGTAFHKMSPDTMQQIIGSMPELTQGAEKQAYALNNGLVSPQSLVMEGAASTSNFAGNDAPNATRGSFVNAEMNRRAAGQQQAALN